MSNATSGRRYRIGAKLGAGGFGTVYQVKQLGTGFRFPEPCCLKVSPTPDGWHGEAYFGQLLEGVPGVVRVWESFAWIPSRKPRRPLYCLVSEYAECGDVEGFLNADRSAWPEQIARRQIIRLAKTVGLLHDAGAVHRDITPRNVFINGKGELMLGDFGIAAHRVGRREVAANAFAPGRAPTRVVKREQRTWTPADDVYYLGHLYALLLKGAADRKLTQRDVKNLACSPEAKIVIQRCIGIRRKRYPDAVAMLSALQVHDRRKIGDSGPRPAIRTLEGKRVVFTGPLSILRADAEKRLKKAGGTCQSRVGADTDVIVVGGQSPNWKAELEGQKLLDVRREEERGHVIPVIREARFLALVERPRTKRA